VLFFAGFWESTVAVLAPTTCPAASSQGNSCFEGYSITNLPAALSRGVCDCNCYGAYDTILATSSTSCNADCASSSQCTGATVVMGTYSSQQTYLANFPSVGSVAYQYGTICVAYGVDSCNSSISRACHDSAMDGATYTKYLTVTRGDLIVPGPGPVIPGPFCSDLLYDLGTNVTGQPLPVPQQYTFFTMCSSNNCNSAPPPPPPPPPSPPPAPPPPSPPRAKSGVPPVKPALSLAILVAATYIAHV
jgi:hypothetical protein